MHRRMAFLLTPFLLFSLLGAGCGGGGSTDTTPASTAATASSGSSGDVATILASIKPVAQQGPQKIALNLAVVLDGTLKDPTVGALLGSGPIALNLSGPVDATGKAADLAFDVKAGKINLAGGLRLAGDKAFLKLADKWYELPADSFTTTTSGSTGSVDVAKALEALGDPSALIKNGTVVGSEVIDGIDTDHIAGDVDTAELVKAIVARRRDRRHELQPDRPGADHGRDRKAGAVREEREGGALGRQGGQAGAPLQGEPGRDPRRGDEGVERPERRQRGRRPHLDADGLAERRDAVRSAAGVAVADGHRPDHPGRARRGEHHPVGPPAADVGGEGRPRGRAARRWATTLRVGPWRTTRLPLPAMAAGTRIELSAMGAVRPPAATATAAARRREEQGFDAVWWADHFLHWFPLSIWTPDLVPQAAAQASPHVWFDPFPVIAAAAAATTDVRLGVGVTDLVRRHPAVVAQTALTLDHLTGGRFILGVGSGEQLNLDPIGLGNARPLGRLAEGLRVIRALFDTPDPIDFDGEFFTLRDMALGLRPLGDRPPPIWVAAHRPRGLELVGSTADGWLPLATDPAAYGAMLAQVRDASRTRRAGARRRDAGALRPCRARRPGRGRGRHRRRVAPDAVHRAHTPGGGVRRARGRAPAR